MTDAAPALQIEAGAAPGTFTRLWYGFMSARVAVAASLLVVVVVFAVFGPLGPVLAIGNQWLITLCAVYLAATLMVRLALHPLPPGDAFDHQRVPTIGVDLLMFAALQYLQAGGINYAPLFALPVLLAGVMGSSLLALGTAAAVTLLLLTEGWVLALNSPGEAATRMLQAGLTGLAYFAVAALANQLAGRLAREEAAARRSQEAARLQARVNALVIETLGDGILVVDARSMVNAANPAARALLGLPHGAHALAIDLASREAWTPLAALAARAFAERRDQTTEITLPDARGAASGQRLRLSTRLSTSRGNRSDGLCVIFLQDLRETEARLRTEKLAAMGRMSAAVAHEIRNPLAAITQANALLEEDLVDPTQQRLSALVRQNAARLARIVDEVLDLARVPHSDAPGQGPDVELDPALAAACADWTAQASPGRRLGVSPGAPGLRVPFDAEHLRRVLVNLLDNALRFASTADGAIQVSSRVIDGRAELAVWSDGAPMESSVQRHLFEPFFSSESRSSGLGLYICRELCERHGAAIGYRRTGPVSGSPASEGNEFFVRFGTRTALTPPPGLGTMSP